MKSMTAEVQFGKVRVNTAINAKERILTSTSRISAFDCVLPFDVENKGQILQAISVYFFTQTRDIIPNHFIGCLDAQSMLVKSGRVLPLEVIVRATLSGSLWRVYSKLGPAEVEQQFGIILPTGLTQHARFPAPLVTFTTKAAFGHDEVVTPHQATEHVQRWLAAQNLQPTNGTTAQSLKLSQPNQPNISDANEFASTLVHQIQKVALRLFERGQNVALEAGLLLLDTKYEFALDENQQLMLVDEIHTPDASRYVDLEQFNAGQIEHLSKEWLREIIQTEEVAFQKTATPSDVNMPFILRPFWQSKQLTDKLTQGLAAQYQKLFDKLFAKLRPWDLISPHLLPWPVDPNIIRNAEATQRLPQKVLVVGNGGRDYTIASFIERAAEIDVVYCWPGRQSWNGGKKAALGHLSTEQLLNFCEKENIGWAVFGPEIPIAQGIAEKLRERGIPCLAPDLAGAKLESSKIHTKDVLQRAGCPTAEAWTVGWNELKALGGTSTQRKPAHPVLDQYPYVLKYESLASGKGVCLVFNEQERTEAIAHFEANLPSWLKDLSDLAVETLTRRSGEAQFLVEKLLPGKEISAIALCHGEDFVVLPYAQDFKRRNDGQTGPNTGGMGSVCPVALPAKLDEQIKEIFTKTLKTLSADGQPYRGFLFAGLMVDDNNHAQVLEFNCRLGDPETQVILPGLGRELLLNMWLTSKNQSWVLNPWRNTNQPHQVRHDELKRCFVVVASPEYPNSNAPRRTLTIPSQWMPECEWIPSGVDAENTTTAGRIAGVLCAAVNEDDAVQGAYRQVTEIGFKSESSVVPHFRRDVAFPVLNEDTSK